MEPGAPHDPEVGASHVAGRRSEVLEIEKGDDRTYPWPGDELRS